MEGFVCYHIIYSRKHSEIPVVIGAVRRLVIYILMAGKIRSCYINQLTYSWCCQKIYAGNVFSLF